MSCNNLGLRKVEVALVRDRKARAGMARVRLPLFSNCSVVLRTLNAKQHVDRGCCCQKPCVSKPRVRARKADRFPRVQDSGISWLLQVRLSQRVSSKGSNLHLRSLNIQGLSIPFARPCENMRTPATSGASSASDHDAKKTAGLCPCSCGWQPRGYRRRTALLRRSLACRSMFGLNPTAIPRTLTLWLARAFDSY